MGRFARALVLHNESAGVCGSEGTDAVFLHAGGWEGDIGILLSSP